MENDRVVELWHENTVMLVSVTALKFGTLVLWYFDTLVL
jgi:hypothetical protein